MFNSEFYVCPLWVSIVKSVVIIEEQAFFTNLRYLSHICQMDNSGSMSARIISWLQTEN